MALVSQWLRSSGAARPLATAASNLVSHSPSWSLASYSSNASQQFESCSSLVTESPHAVSDLQCDSVTIERQTSSVGCSTSGSLSSSQRHLYSRTGTLLPSAAAHVHEAGHQLQQRWKSTAASTQGQAKDSGSTSPSAATEGAAQPALPAGELDLESMLRVLMTPMPLGRVRNTSMNDSVVEMNRSYWMDPAKTLESVTRMLYVVKQVLRDDGLVYIVNTNQRMQPLVKEAALCCANPNVFFRWRSWEPGMLLTGKGLFSDADQPARRFMQASGIKPVNVHCPARNPLDMPKPSLSALDKWRLFVKRGSREERGAGPRPKELLRTVVANEIATARLQLPGHAARPTNTRRGRLQLVVLLDATQDHQVLDEAYESGILTAALVNGHSDLSRVTYPVYASEFNPAFQHFLLDWLVKVVNWPPAPRADAAPEIAGLPTAAPGGAAR